MNALVAIIPSRGRPHQAREVVTAFRDTCQADTRLVIAVDRDDPTLEAYLDLLQPDMVDVYIAPAPSTMVATLNAAARQYAPDAYALAFMGDDHRPRTPGWDLAYLDALHGMTTGIVFGDDLLQHGRLPTQAAVTSDIVKALGHMAPPVLTHLYVDDYWLVLGKGADCIRYLPDVVVEHVHPFAGKAAMDDGYARVNDPAMYAKDGAAWADYAPRHLPGDVEKVRALRDA